MADSLAQPIDSVNTATPDEPKQPLRPYRLGLQIAKQEGLPDEDALLIPSIIAQESSGRPDAIGAPTKYGRAKGLMQFIPSTGAQYGLATDEDFLDPEKNIRAGVRYIKDLSTKFGGDHRKMLAAYYGADKDGYVQSVLDTREGIREKATPLLDRLNKQYGISAPPATQEAEDTPQQPVATSPPPVPAVQASTASSAAADAAVGKYNPIQTQFDKDSNDAAILYSKQGAKAAKGFDPYAKIVNVIAPNQFDLNQIIKEKDRTGAFTTQYFKNLGLDEKQTKEFMAATGWKLKDPAGLAEQFNNYEKLTQGQKVPQIVLPGSVDVPTAAMVEAFKTGGPEAAKQADIKMKNMKSQYDQTLHEITDDERAQFGGAAGAVGKALQIGASLFTLGADQPSKLDVARGLTAMKLGALNAVKDDLHFWQNILPSAVVPQSLLDGLKKMDQGFEKNKANLGAIEANMGTGSHLIKGGVAMSGMLLRTTAAGAALASAGAAAGATAAAMGAAQSGYFMFDTLINNLHKSPEERANAMVTSAILSAIPELSNVGLDILKQYGAGTSLGVGTVAAVSKVMKPAAAYDLTQFIAATGGTSAAMYAQAKQSGATDAQANAAALLGLSPPALMRFGGAMAGHVLDAMGKVASPDVPVNIQGLSPEFQAKIAAVIAAGQEHPLVSNIINIRTKQRALAMGLDAEAIKASMDNIRMVNNRRTQAGGISMQVPPQLLEQYRQVLSIHSEEWTNYGLNGTGVLGVASFTGNPSTKQVAQEALKAPIANATGDILKDIRTYAPEVHLDEGIRGVSIGVDEAQTIATKLLTHGGDNSMSFAHKLLGEVDKAKENGYNRVGIVNVEAANPTGQLHEGLHGEYGRAAVKAKAKAQEQANQILNDNDYADKLSEKYGTARGRQIQETIARQVASVGVSGKEPAENATVGTAKYQKNKTFFDETARNTSAANLLGGADKAAVALDKLETGLKKHGYMAKPETAQIERVYEAIPHLMDKEFLKENNISAKEAEALAIAEVQGLNLDSKEIHDITRGLPKTLRDAFDRFQKDRTTQEYVNEKIAPSQDGSGVSPTGGTGGKKSVQGGSTQRGIGQSQKQQRGEQQPQAVRGTNQTISEQQAKESTVNPDIARINPTVAEGSKFGVEIGTGEKSAPRTSGAVHGEKFSIDPDDAAGAYNKDLANVRMPVEGKTAEHWADMFLDGLAPSEQRSTPSSQRMAKEKLVELASTYKNPDFNQYKLNSLHRALEYFGLSKGDLDKWKAAVTTGQIEIPKFEPRKVEPAPEAKPEEAPLEDTNVRMQDRGHTENADLDRLDYGHDEEPAREGGKADDVVEEIKQLRRDFMSGKVALSQKVTLSNGTIVHMPKARSLADMYAVTKKAQGEALLGITGEREQKEDKSRTAYGNSARQIHAFWANPGSDSVRTNFLNRFGLDGITGDTKEQMELMRRAISKSMANPRLKEARIGELVKDEFLRGEERDPSELGLAQTPASDLYKWAGRRQLTGLFPEPLMNVGKDVAMQKAPANVVSLYSRTPEDKAISHPDPKLDGQEMVGRTSDGRAIVPNPDNASGVSVVKDRAHRETAMSDSTVPLYNRILNPKPQLAKRLDAVTKNKDFTSTEKATLRNLYADAQRQYQAGNERGFTLAIDTAIKKEQDLYSKYAGKIQKVSEGIAGGIRTVGLTSPLSRAKDIVGTMVNVETHAALNPLKRAIGAIADKWDMPGQARADKEGTTYRGAGTADFAGTMPKLNPRDWTDAHVTGLVSGLKDAAQIITEGRSDFQARTGIHYQWDNMNTGWKIYDKLGNMIGRTFGNAADSIGVHISHAMIMNQFAREYSRGFPKTETAQRMSEFLNNPSEEAMGIARFGAEYYTYNNENAMGRLLSGYIDQSNMPVGLKQLAKIPVATFFKYMKVPSNVWGQRMRNVVPVAPMLTDAAMLYHSMFEGYNPKTGKYEIAPEVRRQRIENLAQSTMGTALTSALVAGSLYAYNNMYNQAVSKNMAGHYDPDDKTAGKLDEARGMQPEEMNVAGKVAPSQSFGNVQAIGVAHKDFVNDLKDQGIDKEGNLKEPAGIGKGLLEMTWKQVMDHPLARGAQTVVNLGSARSQQSQNAVGNIGLARDTGSFNDDYKRSSPKGDDMAGNMAVLGLDKSLPAKVSATGDPLLRHGLKQVLTGQLNYKDSPGLDEVDRLGISLPRHQVQQQGSKYTPDQLQNKAEDSGKAVKKAVDALVASPVYSKLTSDQDRALALNDAVKAATADPYFNPSEVIHNTSVKLSAQKAIKGVQQWAEYKNLAPSQKMYVESAINSAFNKFKMTDARKAKGDVELQDLQDGYTDYVNEPENVKDIFEAAREKAVDKGIKPYERKRN